MKGYIPIEIPTKQYIAAYLKHELGPKPLMTTEHRFGCKLNDILNYSTNERRTEFANVRYNAKIKIYITWHTFIQRGANLNHTNIKSFNLFVENEIKYRYRMYMDFYMQMLPSFANNLPAVRKQIGIDLEAWDDDSIKKDYYRYRLKNKKPLLYKNNFDRILIPKQNHDPAF